jgi:Lrp/AsnC family transcriptional regulator, leucine-responsive regulatory protein
MTGLAKMDRKILTALQREGRLTNVALADTIGMSPSPCLRRVRQLEASGQIQSYKALLDRE